MKRTNSFPACRRQDAEKVTGTETASEEKRSKPRTRQPRRRTKRIRPGGGHANILNTNFRFAFLAKKNKVVAIKPDINSKTKKIVKIKRVKKFF